MVKVGIVQTRTYTTNKEAITRVSKFLEDLGKKKTKIVCLPEQWLKNNEINDFDSEFLEFKEIAKKYQMTIIPGAFYEKIKSDVTISSPVIGPKGNIIGRQVKIHPFDYEKNTVTPGTETKIFDTAWKFGVVICYDMVFPKVSEMFVKKGAQILFSPSRIVRRGIYPWETYVLARSLENRVPILAANVKNKKYGGNSIIIDLFENNKVMIPKTIKIKEEGYAVKNINLSKFEKNRKIRFLDSKKFE